MPEISILGAGDASVLASLAPGVFDHPVRGELARECLEDPRHHLVVAIEEGDVVGMASALHYVHPDKAPELWINEIGVAPSFRGRGIGGDLLRALLGLARDLGCNAGEPRGMAVREARPEDREELVKMRTALWPDSSSDEVDALLRGDHEPWLLLVVGRPEAGLGAFAEVGERRFAEGCATSPVAYLEGIWVDPDLRRTGTGAALVQAGIRWARERGLSEIASDAALDNADSHAFHRANGFTEIERVVCYRRPLGED